MQDLKIESKTMNKFGTRYVMYFLADPQFSWDGFNIDLFRSKTLCWYGKFAEIQQKIHNLKIVDQVVKEEINKFRTDYAYVIKELYRVGTEEQVLTMVKAVEDFITETINMSYD